MLASLLAQADAAASDKIATPHVDWVAIAPTTILIGGAVALLLVSSLVRMARPPKYLYAGVSALVAIAAALSTEKHWERVRHGRAGGFIADAVKVDGFSVFLTLAICAAIALAVLIADDYLRREGLDGVEFYALALLSGAGGVIMAQANDLIVLFLGLEVLSIALYVLAGSHVRKAESQEAAMKYFVLGAFSSAVLLYGIALTYGATGSTNLGEITTYLSTHIVFGNGLLIAGMALLLVGLGFKIAAVPFHMWSPDVYQGSPTPATGFMAAAAKTAGFAGLLRVFVSTMQTQRLDWQPIVWTLAVLSMVIGSVLAVMQTDIKRMLAYSSISHAGFILVGVQAATDDGVSSALFYLLAYTFIVLGSFAVITVVAGRGDNLHDLDTYKGLSRRRPVLALVFTLFLFAQAGVPLTSGFVAKFGVISAAVDSHSYAIAIIAMLSAVIAAFFYLRIIVLMYMAEPEGDRGRLAIPLGIAIVLVATAGFTLFGGILPQYLVDFAKSAVLG